ncbi:M48 family metalloprotease [Piscinibacter sakaiensis]|uniref:M48 family metalloprotease n=1 Tax=Piscinibacter sakaiensis TaxID=1547922 RepID=UPI00372BDD78
MASSLAFTPLPTRGGWRRALAGACAALLLSGSLPPPARAQNNLPALGDSVSEDFGVGTERRLGDQIMREIRRDPDYADDPLLQDYLESLWQPLVAAARSRGEIDGDTTGRFAWEVFLVRDRSVNAFALPGGFVGVHLGLIAMTASSDELASVLAHELSHVTQRHIARSITNSRRQSLLSAAAMILGVIAAGRSGSADAANAVIAGGQAAAIQGQLNFSRDMEREADRIGFGLLTGAGFSPAGMAAMFEKLDQASRLNDSGSYPYLRSHPLTTERIGEARSRLGAAVRRNAR